MSHHKEVRIFFNFLRPGLGREGLNNNNLLNGNQSGFRPGDSCVHQLVLIVHNVCNASDANLSLEWRRVFLELSKASDQVWHDGLLYKLKRM